MNQRGTRDRDSSMANTCASSCVRTIPQLKAWFVGACEVMTRPKQTPATPIAGQAGRAHRELVRIAVELEHQRAARLEPVAGDEVAIALLQVGRDDLRDGGAARGGNAKAQARPGDGGVARGDRLLEQVQQVVGADVVRVAFPGAPEGVEAGVLVAQPQQRHRQHRQAARVVGIRGDSLARDVAGVVVAAVVRQRLRHEREEGAVVRAGRQIGGTRALVAGAVVDQQRRRRRHARGADVLRVRAADGGDVGRGRRPVLGIQRQRGPQRQRARVGGVDRQRAADLLSAVAPS